MTEGIKDPVATLRQDLQRSLEGHGEELLESDASLGAHVPWTPHLLDKAGYRAWHCLTEFPPSERWAVRMETAVSLVPRLQLGVCGPIHILKDQEILALIDRMEAAVHIADPGQELLEGERLYSSACDLIYSHNLQLSHSVAVSILDRALDRALSAADNLRKGVLLEVLAAVLLSQVSGFEVVSRGISNRSQQLDVLVHNRNTSGVLRSGEIVIAEAKNWSSPVGTPEYYSIVRKIESRHGRAKMGFFITTDRFTRGVHREAVRDSMRDLLVVTLDYETLPQSWRVGDSITSNIEKAVIMASVAD